MLNRGKTVMLEREVERYLCNVVTVNGGKCLKWSSPQNRGVPDRIVFLNGQVWFIELKRPGGTLRKLQQYTIDWLKKYTHNVIVLDSKISVDNFINLLKENHRISLKNDDSMIQISSERSKK